MEITYTNLTRHEVNYYSKDMPTLIRWVKSRDILIATSDNYRDYLIWELPKYQGITPSVQEYYIDKKIIDQTIINTGKKVIIKDLPEEIPNNYFIVSNRVVRAAEVFYPERKDLLYPSMLVAKEFQNYSKKTNTYYPVYNTIGALEFSQE